MVVFTRWATALSLAFALAGCATSAQREVTRMNEAMAATVSDNKACDARLNASD